MSFLTLLVEEVEPSLSPSLSVPVLVWLLDAVAVVAVVAAACCGMDRPRLCNACINAFCI